MLLCLYFQLTQSYIHWKIVVEWTTMKTANIFLLKSALCVSTPVTMTQHILTNDVTVHAIVTTLVEYLWLPISVSSLSWPLPSWRRNSNVSNLCEQYIKICINHCWNHNPQSDNFDTPYACTCACHCVVMYIHTGILYVYIFCRVVLSNMQWKSVYRLSITQSSADALSEGIYVCMHPYMHSYVVYLTCSLINISSM